MFLVETRVGEASQLLCAGRVVLIPFEGNLAYSHCHTQIES